MRIADGVIHKQVGEELVLLDFERGIYFGLDSVGARIWQLIAEDQDVDAIVETLLAEYETTREVLERDVAALIGELEVKGLLQRA